jgi:tetratricopeptide (TPR) repeat protein
MPWQEEPAMQRSSTVVQITTLLWLAQAPLPAQTLEDARQLHIEGDYQAALQAYRGVAESQVTSDPATAATAHNNSCVIYNGLADYQAARAECDKALEIRRRLDDNRRLARTLNNLAIAQQNIGDYESARDSFGEALTINSRRGDAKAQVLNYSNLGALAILSGSYGKALEFQDLATKLAGKHSDESWADEQLWIAAINRGVVLERLGAFREALGLYRDLSEGSLPADRRRRAQLKSNMGAIYRNLGDPVRAVREFEEVVDIYRRLEDPDGLSNALLNLGLVFHLNLERPVDAEAAYREALELSVRQGDRPEEIADLFYLGQFLLDHDRHEEAELMFSRCLKVSSESGSSEGRWSALSGLGRIAAARREYDRAIEYLGAAIEEIEEVGGALPTGILLSRFFGSTRPVYAATVKVLAELDRLEPDAGHDGHALEVVQRAKARALLDALGNGEWNSRPLTGADLRQVANTGPVIEYFVAEGELYRWLIQPAMVRMDHLGPYEPVLATSRRIYRALSADSLPESTDLDELSRTLLSGAALPASSNQRVTIAADGVLGRVPFELLPMPDEQNDLLLDRFSVSYVPSASMIAWLRQRHARHQGPGREAVAVRAFVNPEIGAEGPKNTSAAGRLASRHNLQPLTATDIEIEALAENLPGRHEFLSGKGATETALRLSIGRHARILHLAAHAVIDERPGRGAAILLGADSEEDGLLYPREIAALEHRVDLTVLAACRTALDTEEGGALSTLTGSFLAAGSSAVVATLWDVGDRATATFMDQFYYQLGRGLTPAAALTAAKQRLRSEPLWSRPSLWAGYILVGDAPAIVQRRTLTPLRIGAAGVAIWALIFLWGLRSRTTPPSRLPRPPNHPS